MDTNNATATNNSMISFLDNYSNQESNIKNSTAAAEQQNRINTSLWFYEQSYNPSTAVELRNQQHNASRAWKLASMIVQYWADNWVTVTWTDSEIINNYIANLPEQVRWTVASRFADYTHATEYMEDSKDFALEMWWRKNEWYDDVWDGIKWVAEYLWYGPYKLWSSFRKFADNATLAWNKEQSQKSIDVMNLANERYWFLAWMDWYLSDEDWEDLQWEVDNMQQSVDKQHNLANIAMDMWIWAVMTAANLTWLWATINLWVWVASQLPITKDILERANEVAWDIWTWVNKYMPWLSQYRDALWDEKSKTEFDYFVGNMIVWALLWAAWKYRWLPAKWFKRLWEWKKWWNWWAWWSPKEMTKTVKDWLKNVNPEEVTSEFEKNRKETIENWMKQLTSKDFWKFEENEEWIKKRDAITRALWLINKEWIKTFKETYEATKKRIKQLVDVEDKLLSQDKKLYKSKDIKELTKDKNNPEWFDFLDVIFKNVEDAFEETKWELWTDNRTWFKDMEKKYKSEWLTRKEINDVLRKTQSVVKMYNKKGRPATWWLEAKTDAARMRWKQFVWDWLDELLPWNKNVFDNLDNSISDLYDLEDASLQKMMEVENSKWQEYYKWEAREDFKSKTRNRWYDVRKWIKWWIKDTALNIIDRWARIKDYNVQWVEDLLPETYKDFDLLSKELWDTNKIKKIEEDINNLYNKAKQLASIEENINKLEKQVDAIWESNKKTTKKAKKTKKQDELQKEYVWLFEWLLEDLWATKEVIKSVTQESLFDM